MKNQIIFLLLIPFLTNCGTLVGLTVDSIVHNNRKSHNTDEIHEGNQPITFETIYDVSVHARYDGLIYKTDSINYTGQSLINGEANNRIINLPPIGDSLTLLYDNQKKITGEFKGINKCKPEYQLMVFNNDLYKTEHIELSSISKLSWNDNLFEIQEPDAEKLFMKYEINDLRSEIALSKLKHLNTNTPDRKNTFTKTGLAVDIVIGVIGLIGYLSLGGLDFEN